ncbi:MAG: DUF1934 domain-containing protein [Oscillospiraceae bacterium]|nr:DUF1934 domain-containing protein [Oscillospiraceae bacterium]
MKQTVVLSITGRQNYPDQEPEVIELVTEGTMEFRNGGWDISYEESELTGLAGVTTTFRVEPGKVVLTRTGALKSQMIFQQDVPHESLYQMPFGALMLTVKATSLFYDIVPDGGVIDLSYNISIENTEAGVIDYHLDIRAK